MISQNAKWLGEVMAEVVSTFKKLIYSNVIRIYPVKLLRGWKKSKREKREKKEKNASGLADVCAQHVNHGLIIRQISQWTTMQTWLRSRLNDSPCWRNKLPRYRRDVLSSPVTIRASSFACTWASKSKLRKDPNLIAALLLNGRSRPLVIC